MDWDKWHKIPEVLSAQAHMPSSWLTPVVHLIRCTRLLRERLPVGDTVPADVMSYWRGPELMLAGMAIESMLKCIEISRSELWRRERWEKPGTYEGKVTHDLVRMAQFANVPLEGTEPRICEVLTHFITWRPRYPTARDVAKWDPTANWDRAWDSDLDRCLDRLLALAGLECERTSETMSREYQDSLKKPPAASGE